MSRNLNIYTPKELEAFSSKLVEAPIYLEHVSASNAVGKVTKTSWDGQRLLYEAEIYDENTADKIRNGLIRHVSVGADYSTSDVVDAMVPHGLFNAEMSLVAVPGIPETSINVLESLAHVHTALPASGKERKPVRAVHEKFSVKELLESLQCVFCGAPGEYLVSVCTPCGDNAQSLVMESLMRLPVREAESDLPSSFTAFKVKFVAGPDACDKCKALDGKVFIYGTEPEPHTGCKCPGYQVVERLHVHINFRGVEKLEEKDIAQVAEKVAAKVGEKNSFEFENMKTKLAEAEGKLKTVEGERDAFKSEAAAAKKTVEDYKKLMPGVELLADPPVLMPVSEAVSMIKGVLPGQVVERAWGFGPQRMCQELQRAVNSLEKRLVKK
ncbi:MAG: hypothetical protein NWF01_07800 [Candidatus Bathyarchaeota archaeon]|nr:hypothetical protein [Candidatus Bathyarchaeota archaeon]